MRRFPSHLWLEALGIVFLGCLMLTTPAAAQFLSPGPIAKEHGEIAGDDACSRCHKSGEGVPDALCLDCHRPIKNRIAKGTGFHGHSLKGEPCARCHQEHLGREGHLIRWPGGSPEAFNHASTGWPLTGGHADVKCRDCHKEAFHQEGNLPAKSWLGLPTACAECHKDDDPHKGQFARRACDTCHVTAKWKELDHFDHAKTHYPLRDKHTELKCDKCHKDGKFAETPLACAKCHETPHPAVTEFGADCTRCHSEKGWPQLVYARAEHKKFPLEGGHTKPDCKACHGDKAVTAPPVNCADCHKDSHAGRFGRKCQGCHQIADWHRLIKGAAIDHDKTGFPLRGQHPDVECEQCHKAGRFKPIAHGACLDCHKDPHKGDVEGRCEDCHVVDGFRPALYPIAKHTAFELTGAHRAVACNDCHRPVVKGKPGPLDFRAGTAACADCHRDQHEGQFEPRTCEKCHTTSAWAGAGAQHEIWPLAGSHAKTPCASCHDGGQYVGTPRECRDCHGDPHLGQFTVARAATQGTPAAASAAVGAAAEKGCSDCHTAEAWKGAFDHTKVWPLEGLHGDAECGACHKEVRVGDGRVTLRWRLGFQDCGRCHENVHRKQTTNAQLAPTAPETVAPPVGETHTFDACAQCHSPVDWHEVRSGGTGGGFDHDPTGFPLRGQHAAQSCASCHQGRNLRGARCVTCHSSPHRGPQQASPDADRCDTCHTTRDWRLPEALAAHNRTRFPLQGQHLTAACRECHRGAANNVWRGVDSRCASCHGQDAAGLHPAHKVAPFTTQCDLCHNPYGWSPALVDHTRWWSLTGAHATADCSRCHVGGRFAGTATRCASCHSNDFRRGHEPSGSQDCAECHTTTTWSGAVAVDHQRLFPLPHRGVSECKNCHPSGTGSFSCTTCHTHSRARMQSEHDEVRSYVFEPQACYRCHPRGVADD